MHMQNDLEALYEQRLSRYLTAMRNGQPDRVPIRPFAAEVTAKYAGFTCQQVTHDYRMAFEAVVRCCRDFDWDAAVPNMVYVWTGLTQAIGLRYYGVPGIDVGPDVTFQYREPAEDRAFMKREEYDELIDDPTRFLYETWLPRVNGEAVAKGCAVTYRNNLSFVKGGMAMLDYFHAFGPQIDRMRTECGTVSAICGMLKAPLDILGDKLRGYMGYLALTGADPQCRIPIPIWMHRGCTPFISKRHFQSIYWPTLKPIVEALWAQGNQTLLYAEGKWDAHLEDFAELPAGSVIFHIDRSDPAAAHRVLGHKFCLSGGVPNTLLAFGSPEDVKAHCRRLIESIGAEGGYIMDASAIMQNDASIENLKAMTDATREFGVYRSPSAAAGSQPAPAGRQTAVLPGWACSGKVPPGVCFPFEQKARELPPIVGDAALTQRVWNDIEGLAYLYLWHVLLSF
jgi:uroporphyrinogen-III decarboxylase